MASSGILSVYSFASGSSGNAMLVRSAASAVLIDAGLGVRVLTACLARMGVAHGGLDGILITHEHWDHAANAAALARKFGAPLIANAPTIAAIAAREDLEFGMRELPTGGEIGVAGLTVRSFPVSHDAVDPVGFVIGAGAVRIAYATDCGMPTAELRQAIRGAKLVIIEANHDVDCLLRGPYSPAMKERVASATGHLSNVDCATVIAERLELDGPARFWLAHLSRVNNSPALARRSVAAAVAAATTVPFALEVALRDSPSVVWHEGQGGLQLRLL